MTRIRGAVRDVVVMTGRNLVHLAREPLRLSDVTVQPVLFTLLFIYVLGAGLVLPDHGSYKEFAIAGLLAMNLVTSAIGTAVGLSDDLGTGVVDRLRTLPMWKPAVLVGRSLTDLLTATLCGLIVIATGVVIGWRPHASPGQVIAGFAIFLLFQLRTVLGLRLHRPVQPRCRVISGDRPGDPVPARDRLRCARPDAAHARSRAGDRRLEPRQQRDRCQPPPVRQPQPDRHDSRVASAARRAGIGDLVVRAPRRVRAACDPALPHADRGLTGRTEALPIVRPMEHDT